MRKDPLFLPEGSVRAILAIMIFSFTVLLLSIESQYAQEFISLTTVIIGYYFGFRSSAQKEKVINPYRD